MRKLFALGLMLAIAATLVGCGKKSEESSEASDNDVGKSREKIVQNFCEAFRVCDGKLLMSCSMSKPADAGIQDENSLLPFMFTVALSDEPVKTKVLKSHTDDERSVSIIEATCNNSTGLDGVPTCLYFYVGHENKKEGKDKGDKITGITTDKEFISKTIKKMEELESGKCKKESQDDDERPLTKKEACHGNMILLNRAAEIWKSENFSNYYSNYYSNLREGKKFNDKTPTLDDLCGPEETKYIPKTPTCPCGGKYRIREVSDGDFEVLCSEHGSLAELNKQELDDHPELKAEYEAQKAVYEAKKAVYQKKACISNMRQLQTAGESWKTKGNNISKTPTLDDLCGPEKYLMRTPTCPSGGRYRIRTTDKPGAIDVFCSEHGSLDKLMASGEKIAAERKNAPKVYPAEKNMEAAEKATNAAPSKVYYK